MRPLFIITLILASVAAFAQTTTVGLDNSTLLTDAEAQYLNEKFAHQRGDFNFQGKRIAFATGSTGSQAMTKQEYFADVARWKENNSEVTSSLYILTDEERFSSDLDAIITAWVKVLTKKSRSKIIRQSHAGR